MKGERRRYFSKRKTDRERENHLKKNRIGGKGYHCRGNSLFPFQEGGKEGPSKIFIFPEEEVTGEGRGEMLTYMTRGGRRGGLHLAI